MIYSIYQFIKMQHFIKYADASQKLRKIYM